MPFDQPTRNRLARFVADARTLLTQEFTRQLQNDFGLDPERGAVTELARLTHLDEQRRETARILRATLEHYAAGKGKATAKSRQEALERIVREQAFTVLNRLAALRMAEARGLLIESVSQGYRSKGFQLYARLAGPALGETGDAYRSYLFSLFDEFSVDLAVLFDRFSPQGRLFPRESALLQLLELINHPEIDPLWAEDETIGWVYQYFNSQEERRQMRAESQAPRNSRELAVRNQFFTPRYVVEFLTDNTLGRIWYEMTKGQTRLVDECRYLVRRPNEIFLGDVAQAAAAIGIDYDPESVPPSVTAAFQGDFAGVLDEEIGFNRWWIALSVPPSEWEKITGEAVSDPFEYGFLSRVWEMLDGESPGVEELTSAHWLVALCQFALTSSGGAYAVEPLERLWRALAKAVTREKADDLSQEELLRQPVYIPHRPLKDPRDIKMLDPACGSMHFGLYAFDLFQRIYEEAWQMETANTQYATRNTPLRAAYPTFDALRRDIPRLIIEHNIHGIDIDPRAVQIAGLSLWLRAQRSWHAQGLRAGERPLIHRSNIVCAEPMPGDKALLEEFLAELREERLESLIRRVIAVPENQRVRATPSMADALAGLIRTVWAEMELAGEAGSLLKIEESLAEAIERGRAEWDEKLPLFRVETFRMTGEGERAAPKVNYLKVVPGAEADFWERVEGLVLAALEAYAQRAENGRSYARRLFAGDAARGFAFIDLRRKKYDALLMNPPFGELSVASKKYIGSQYRESKNDIYATFVSSGIELLDSIGFVGAITSRTGFFQSNLQEWRSNLILSETAPTAFVDLGASVLDSAAVDTAAYVLLKDSRSIPCAFFRLNQVDDKAVALSENIISLSANGESTDIYWTIAKTFTVLPGTPFAYWISPKVRSLFETGDSMGQRTTIDMGMSTKDDDRFVRLRWEVAPDTIGWHKKYRFYAKGGSSFSKTAQVDCVVNSYADFQELKANLNRKYPYLRGNTGWVLHPEYHYGFPGLTFGRRVRRFRPQPMPKEVMFSDSNPCIFTENEEDLLWLGSYLGSQLVQCLLGLFAPPRKMEVGYVAKIPYPALESSTRDLLSNFGRTSFFDGIAVQRLIETDGQFVTPFSLADYTSPNVPTNDTEYLIADALGLSKDDANALLQNFAISTGLSIEEEDESLDDESDESQVILKAQSPIEARLSYLIGCAVGRWDIRYATGARTPPELPDPFAPLPVCPPGMLQNAASLPAAPVDVPADYPLRISWPGILVDDPGHPEDIEGRVREALAVIWGESRQKAEGSGQKAEGSEPPTEPPTAYRLPPTSTADAIEQEACQILGVESLRAWFANPNSFFDDHLKRYSKSRRYAPIYWPLSTPSGSYTLWLYYHRLTDQSLYLCVNDFVEPKLKVIGEQLAVIRRKGNRSGQEERELERLDELARELADFRDELLRIARFWRPNLNDGVQITAAPLWRLFRHRGWSKRLQETWEKLEAGEYDWAHLARSVWPQRVIPKCVEDRSLAIAHDVEDLFWVEDGGNWRPLGSPAEEIAEQQRRLSLRRPEPVEGSKPRGRALALLGDLARRRGQSYSGAQLYAHLAAGDWDDLPLARLLWPARAAEKCWNDPLLAMDWRVTLPGKSTKKAQREFFAQFEAEGCPEVVPALAAALAEDETPFPQLWARLAGGQQDDASLALLLWPERVLEKCLQDAALAAVHGLRGFFWVQGADGAWRRRVAVKDEVAGEVGRRA